MGFYWTFGAWYLGGFGIMIPLKTINVFLLLHAVSVINS